MYSVGATSFGLTYPSYHSYYPSATEQQHRHQQQQHQQQHDQDHKTQSQQSHQLDHHYYASQQQHQTQRSYHSSQNDHIYQYERKSSIKCDMPGSSTGAMEFDSFNYNSSNTSHPSASSSPMHHQHPSVDHYFYDASAHGAAQVVTSALASNSGSSSNISNISNLNVGSDSWPSSFNQTAFFSNCNHVPSANTEIAVQFPGAYEVAGASETSRKCVALNCSATVTHVQLPPTAAVGCTTSPQAAAQLNQASSAVDDQVAADDAAQIKRQNNQRLHYDMCQEQSSLSLLSRNEKTQLSRNMLSEDDLKTTPKTSQQQQQRSCLSPSASLSCSSNSSSSSSSSSESSGCSNQLGSNNSNMSSVADDIFCESLYRAYQEGSLSKSRYRRLIANERERKRMHGLNLAFEKLRAVLPSLDANKQFSKYETLQMAKSYIAALRQILLSDTGDTTSATTLTTSSGGGGGCMLPQTLAKSVAENSSCNNDSTASSAVKRKRIKTELLLN